MKNLGVVVIAMAFALAAGCGQQAAVKADGATNSGVQTQPVAVKTGNRPYTWFYATRSRVPVWRTAQEAAQAEAFSNPSSPNPFSTSGEGGKESTTNSPSPLVERGQGGEGLKPLDLLMKYDRVKLYATNGAYALIGLPADSRRTNAIEGLVPTNALAEWRIDVFFTNKDNIFSVESNITLYVDPYAHGRAMPAEGQDGREAGRKGTDTAGIIEKGDAMRVLQGNGSRFMVASKSGKTGWVDLSWLQAEKLVAKGFEYKEKMTYPRKQYPGSIKEINDPTQIKWLMEGKPENIVFNDGRRGYVIAQGDKTVNLEEKFIAGNDNKLTNINGSEYIMRRVLFNGKYLGMILVLDELIPYEYQKKMIGFMSENPLINEPQIEVAYPYDDKALSLMNGYTEKAVLYFYKIGVGLELVKKIELNGVFDILTSIYSIPPDYLISISNADNNSVNLEMKLIGGGINFVNYNMTYEYGDFVYVNRSRKSVSKSDFRYNNEFRAPTYPVSFSFTAEELAKAGLIIEEVRQMIPDNPSEIKVINQKKYEKEAQFYEYLKSHLVINYYGTNLTFTGLVTSDLHIKRGNVKYNNGTYSVFVNNRYQRYLMIYNNKYELLNTVIYPVGIDYLIYQNNYIGLIRDDKFVTITGGSYEY